MLTIQSTAIIALIGGKWGVMARVGAGLYLAHYVSTFVWPKP